MKKPDELMQETQALRNRLARLSQASLRMPPAPRRDKAPDQAEIARI